MTYTPVGEIHESPAKTNIRTLSIRAIRESPLHVPKAQFTKAKLSIHGAERDFMAKPIHPKTRLLPGGSWCKAPEGECGNSFRLGRALPPPSMMEALLEWNPPKVDEISSRWNRFAMKSAYGRLWSSIWIAHFVRLSVGEIHESPASPYTNFAIFGRFVKTRLTFVAIAIPCLTPLHWHGQITLHNARP